MDGMGEGSGVTLAKQIILKISAWITLCRMGNDFWTHKKRHSIQYLFSGSNSSNLFWQTKKSALHFQVSKWFHCTFLVLSFDSWHLVLKKTFTKHILCYFESLKKTANCQKRMRWKLTSGCLREWVSFMNHCTASLPMNIVSLLQRSSNLFQVREESDGNKW